MATQLSTASLSVEVERNPHSIIVRCRGKLVYGVCNSLYHRVHELIPHTRHIVLDLTNLDSLDSMGLGTLVRLYVSCKTADCDFRLIHLGKRVRETLGLANLLDVFADPAENVAACN